MKYFFDFRERGEIIADEEGMELANLQLAQEEAARSLSDLLREALNRFESDGDHEMAILVRDDAGPVLQAKLKIQFDRLRTI